MMMAATVITIAMRKGGCSKTTSCGISAYLLAKEGYRVLAVDADSQGNLSELLLNCEVREFRGKSTLEALKTGNARPYIVNSPSGVHVLPSNALLDTFYDWLYQEYKESGGKRPSHVMSDMLNPVKSSYDVILIDTPPSLSQLTSNALTAADYVVAMFEPSRFCYSALDEVFEFVEIIQEKTNPDLKVAGIFRTLTDVRRTDVKSYNELVEEEYKGNVFKTVVNRKAASGRVGIDGLVPSNPEVKAAVDPYIPFVEELIEKCHLIKKS